MLCEKNGSKQQVRVKQQGIKDLPINCERVTFFIFISELLKGNLQPACTAIF